MSLSASKPPHSSFWRRLLKASNSSNLRPGLLTLDCRLPLTTDQVRLCANHVDHMIILVHGTLVHLPASREKVALCGSHGGVEDHLGRFRGLQMQTPRLPPTLSHHIQRHVS